MNYKCAGIVLYNPEIERLEENIDSILPQVDLLILVDNNSYNIRDIELKYGNNEKIILIKNKENKGIASALNSICNKAILENYQWVLLLDQDSICSEKIIENYSEFLSNEKVALLTPYIIDTNKMSLEDYKKLELDKINLVNWAITSGSMINLEIWNFIDKFSEELFIDAVDLDFSLRLSINNYLQLRVNKAYLLQEVGKAEKTWLKRIHKDNSGKFSIKSYYRSNHSPIRQYYMARNHIILSKKYKNHFSLWKTIPLNLIIILPKILFEKPKIVIAKHILNGLKDGISYQTEVYKKEGEI